MTTSQHMHDLFRGHAGAHGTHGAPTQSPGRRKWEIKSTAKTLREPPTLEHWQAHLSGERPLGIVAVTEDSTSHWGSVDVDEYDEDLSALVKMVYSRKLPLVPCRSKSGGLHLFMFLAEPQPASSVQAVLRDLAAELGLAGSEIFPKQTKVLAERGDVGNWMVMPYFGSTYDGKIREQVGLKKTGAEMTINEFIRAAESVRLDTAAFGELAARPSRKPKKRTKANGSESSAGDFTDGPPCLQHLASQGVKRGVQNNTLFMMGLYFKRAAPADWKEKLEEANQTYLTPPGTAEGLSNVIKQLEKKDYEYTCKTEPMCSHCDSALCRTRRFGVGDGGNYPDITSLSKLNINPAIWFVDIGGTRIEASTEQLQNYNLFHRLCMEEANTCFSVMRQDAWLRMISAAMDSLTLIEAPAEVGTAGRFREVLEDFLTNRQRGTRREDLLSKRPWEDEEEQRHYFRLQDLQRHLDREDMRDDHGGRMRRGRITRLIERMGGGPHFFNIKGRGVSVWWVPSSAVHETPDVEPPQHEGAAI